MANLPAAKAKPSEPLVEAHPITVMSVVAPAVAWLIPGAGHLIQKRWIRGALLMFSIVAMFLLGLAMQGRIYKPNGGDILDMLGFVGKRRRLSHDRGADSKDCDQYGFDLHFRAPFPWPSYW